MAAAVEAHNDQNGILWPISIAPYEVAIIVANMADELQRQTAEEIYSELRMLGVEALLDDRTERIGVKFKDIDLIGIPVQVVVGKGLASGVVEVGLRRGGAPRSPVPVADAASHISTLVKEEKAKLGAGQA